MSDVIIFKGDVLPGFDPEIVKEEFAHLERLPREVTDSIFIGRPFVLKDRLTDTDISDYFPTLARIGMDVAMVDNVSKDALSFDMVKQKYLQSMGVSAGSYLGAVFSDYEVDVEPVSIPKVFSLNFSGRFGRLNYINATMMVFISFIPLAIFAGIAIVCADRMIIGTVLSGLIAVAIWIMMMIFSVRNVILRLHDLNLTGWLALPLFIGNVIPVISLFAMVGYILLLAVPGTQGVNKYGPPTVKGHIAGLIVFIGMTMFTVVGYIALIIAGI